MQRRTTVVAGSLLAALVAFLLVIAAAGAAAGERPALVTTWTDNFDDPPLDGRWQWINENPSHWSLTDHPGYLRITTEQDVSGLTNVAYVPAPVADYEIETRVLFSPAENFQFAGLYLVQDEANNLKLGRAYCDLPPPECAFNAIYFDLTEDGAPVGSNFPTLPGLEDEIWLKVVRHSNVYSGFISHTGVSWVLVGVHTTSISPDKVGLSASNQIQGAAEIPADFDYFTLVDQALRIYLPLALRDA
jgi:beta-xylosidase